MQLFALSITKVVHSFLLDAVQKGDTVVDGTCGNGNDTLFLAQNVGSLGKVISFDIQQAAIEKAEKLLIANAAREQVFFHRLCHSKMDEVLNRLESKPSAFVFNLGYCPGNDKTITTTAKTTVTALEKAAEWVKPGGVISVVCYPGHASGQQEFFAVEQFLSALSGNFCVTKIDYINRRKNPPVIFFIFKET